MHRRCWRSGGDGAAAGQRGELHKSWAYGMANVGYFWGYWVCSFWLLENKAFIDCDG